MATARPERPLHNRLRHYDGLKGDIVALLQAAEMEIRHYRAGQEIFSIGDTPQHPMIIESGWACHQQLMPDGARQISQILMPGDIIDDVTLLRGGRASTSVAALETATVQPLDRERLQEAVRMRPDLAQAFVWIIVQGENMLREHIGRIGRRDAAQALGHLFCELMARGEMAGLNDGDSLRMPLRQSEMADYLGLTPVHVSRMMTRLRDSGYVDLERGRLRLPDRKGLIAFSHFSPGYLTVGVAGAAGGGGDACSLQDAG